MEFKLDESLPVEVARVFVEAGHSASTAVEQGLGGASDETIAQRCAADGLVLVTLDVGFADIRAYPPSHYPGLIVLRLKQQDRHSVANVLSRLLDLLAVEQVSKRLWVVDESRIRVRE